MRKSAMRTGLILFFLIFLTAWASAQEKRSSTLEDRVGLEITVYNDNLGFVKEQRRVALPQGTHELRFMDVPTKINPTSVHIKSLTAPQGFAVLEQQYTYDLLSPQVLLDKYIGKEVKLYIKNPYTEREEVVAATVLSNNGGTPVFKIGQEITFGHPGRIIFPGIPENLTSRPTLTLLFRSTYNGPQTMEVFYLTEGLNWRVDYAGVLNDRDTYMDLSGLVTLENKSGASYKEAKLKLVAGEVHRVREVMLKSAGARMEAAPMAAAAPAQQFKEEGLFEYHSYSLSRPATLLANQTKQILLLEAEKVPIQKKYVLQGADYYYRSLYREIPPQKVNAFVETSNKKENNLGLPLPKGVFRFYKQEKEGSLQFIGEDTINHTAQDEKIRLQLGTTFDIAAQRKQTDWKNPAKNVYEAVFEISLRNHKQEDVKVQVIEPIPGDWEITESSLPYNKTSSHQAEFNVPVPKDKEVKLTYRVRMRF